MLWCLCDYHWLSYRHLHHTIYSRWAHPQVNSNNINISSDSVSISIVEVATNSSIRFDYFALCDFRLWLSSERAFNHLLRWFSFYIVLILSCASVSKIINVKFFCLLNCISNKKIVTIPIYSSSNVWMERRKKNRQRLELIMNVHRWVGYVPNALKICIVIRADPNRVGW